MSKPNKSFENRNFFNNFQPIITYQNPQIPIYIRFQQQQQQRTNVQQTQTWNDLQQVNVFPNIPFQTYINSTEGDQNMRKFLNTIGVLPQTVKPIKRKKEEKCIPFYYNLEK